MQRKKKAQPVEETSTTEVRAKKVGDNRDRILIRLVSSISRACIMYASRSTSAFGLSVSQAIVLGELFRHNGCRQEDLRVLVSLDKGNVTRAVQRLEEYGLVQRRQDATDRRAIRVYVTKKALSFETEMFKLASQWDDQLAEGFTKAEREKLIDLLLRMEVNAHGLARSSEADATVDWG